MADSQNIPKGQFSRAAVISGAAIKIGVGQLQSKATRAITGKEGGEQDSVIDDKTAQQLFSTLVKLRGTAIKLAQMLGMEAGLLPENLRLELEKSWHQVPPLNRVLVRKVLQESFEKSPSELFAQFDSTAVAAASLGQVHRATTHEGEQVAVKIQYPGIHVAMESDIKLLRKLALTLPNKKLTSLSIDEIHARLAEELDYKLEAETTAWFRQHLQVDGVVVPRVYPQLSTARVLTTEFLPGQHIDEWLADNPSQAVRDKAAQCLYDSFVFSVRQLHKLHADPNPGNYLFQPDGAVAIIDFGCTRSLSKPFVRHLPDILKAYRDNDEAKLLESYKAVGMDLGDDALEIYRTILQPFGEWLSAPFKTDCFDFGAGQTYTDSGREKILELSKIGDMDSFAEEFIFFDRTIYGLCKLFERFGAKVRMRHHWGI